MKILIAIMVRMVSTKTLIAKIIIVIIQFYLLQISVSGISTPQSYLAEQWWHFFNLGTVASFRRPEEDDSGEIFKFLTLGSSFVSERLSSLIERSIK